jgi:uncharacterized protein YggU (UPF0235/DUF167 family)
LRTGAGQCAFKVRLAPRGGADRIEGWQRSADDTWHLKARVSSPAEDGKANASLIALLANELKIPKSRLSIASGVTARLKTVVATGDADALAAKLTAIGELK